MIEKDIKSAVVGVMLRIICFIAYYIILVWYSNHFWRAMVVGFPYF